METNSKKVLEALPEFEEFLKIASEIKKLSFDRMVTENQIKAQESEIFRRVMTDAKFFREGKVVSVSYFDNAYKFAGIEGELIPLREKLAEINSLLEEKKNQFEIYKQMHDLFKVLVYQERAMS